MTDPGVEAPVTEFGPDGEVTVLPLEDWWAVKAAAYWEARDFLWWEHEMRQADEDPLTTRKYHRTVTGKVAKKGRKGSNAWDQTKINNLKDEHP
jgi:hypothetical protein